eukprot:s171_g36.t1
MLQPFRFHAQGHATQQAVELQPWEFVNLIRLAASLTGTPQLLLSFIIQSACSCIRFAHFQRSRLVADHKSWLEFECSEGKSRKQGVRPHYRWATPEIRVGGFSLLALLRRFFGEILLPGSTFLWPALELQAADLWQVTEATGLLLHRKLSPKVFLEFLRGSLQRCGVAPDIAASATYNKLRRFLPTGANVLGLADSEAQAVGSWVEMARGGQAHHDRHRADLMSVRYSGQRVLSSAGVKARILRVVLLHPLAQARPDNALEPHSFMWHHVVAGSGDAPRPSPGPAGKGESSSSSSSSDSSSSSADESEGSEQIVWPDVQALSAASWFVQGSKMHIVREVSGDEGRPIRWCRTRAFCQVPARQGSDLSSKGLDALCLRCVAAVPPAMRASIRELKSERLGS